MEKEQILKIINDSKNFAEIRNAGILPDPDGDDGYFLISYSHSDYKKVFADLLAFQDSAIKIWYDRGLESGKSWINEVKNKISSYYCKGVIFYLSEKYFASQSCLTEIIHAMQQNKPAIFITLDSAKLPEKEAALEKYFYRYPHISYESPFDNKTELLSLLPKPLLFEFYVQKSLRVFKYFHMRSFALVTNLLDRNLQRVEIPRYAFIDGKKYSVRGIAPEAFKNCELLEEVIVPDKWFFLMQDSFVNCPSLRKVSLGIPRTAFGLKSGVLLKSFSGCENLREIVCPEGRLNLVGTFSHSETLTEANFPENFVIDGACFENCTALERAKLHKTDGIADNIFANCISLKEVSIPDDSFCNTIGDNAFFNCKSLTQIRLPNSIRVVNRSAFEWCSALAEINIPEKISYIDSSAFRNCKNLKKVICDANKYNFLYTPMGKSNLDNLFPSAEYFYLKKAPKEKILERNFEQITSDKEGYILYKKTVKI